MEQVAASAVDICQNACLCYSIVAYRMVPHKPCPGKGIPAHWPSGLLQDNLSDQTPGGALHCCGAHSGLERHFNGGHE